MRSEQERHPGTVNYFCRGELVRIWPWPKAQTLRCMWITPLGKQCMNLFQESLKIGVSDWFSGTEYWFDRCESHLGLIDSSAADGLDGVKVTSVESIINSNLLDVSGEEMTIRNTLRPSSWKQASSEIWSVTLKGGETSVCLRSQSRSHQSFYNIRYKQ